MAKFPHFFPNITHQRFDPKTVLVTRAGRAVGVQHGLRRAGTGWGCGRAGPRSDMVGGVDGHGDVSPGLCRVLQGFDVIT